MSHVELGKVLIVVGIIIVVVGFILSTNTKIPYFGKLPGDIHIQKENFSFHFPLATCIVISTILSLLFVLFSRK